MKFELRIQEPRPRSFSSVQKYEVRLLDNKTGAVVHGAVHFQWGKLGFEELSPSIDYPFPNYTTLNSGLPLIKAVQKVSVVFFFTSGTDSKWENADYREKNKVTLCYIR